MSKIISTNDFPRSANLCYLTPSESLIWNAIQEVEKLGADVRLTNVVILLGQARDLLAEVIDERIVDKKSEVACRNCKETIQACGCVRNKCIKCGESVGNITFTYCDECWVKHNAERC